MKKVLFKLTENNVNKFLDTVISVEAKQLLSFSKDGFLETVIFVWLLISDEQAATFKTNGFDPIKTA